MSIVALLRKWIVATPLSGKLALIYALSAVVLPTLYRLSLDGMVTGIGYCPYLPFVLLAAVLLGWKPATGVALVSAVVADALFIGPRYQVIEQTTDMFGDVDFLIASAFIIALVHAIRTAIDDLMGPTAANGVIFSEREGQAWVSWPTAGFHFRLGSHDEVAEMMKDYIAQVEFGKRLNGEVRPVQVT